MKTEENEKLLRWCILGAIGGILMAAGDWLFGCIPLQGTDTGMFNRSNRARIVTVSSPFKVACGEGLDTRSHHFIGRKPCSGVHGSTVNSNLNWLLFTPTPKSIKSKIFVQSAENQKILYLYKFCGQRSM